MKKESNYIPYTYLIGWKNQNLWYYGSESKNKSGIAHPDNLWVSYFTSSHVVKRLRKEHGDPDVIQIRRTFSCPHACLAWEQKVLSRIRVVGNPKWINRAVYGNRQFSQDEEVKTKRVSTRKTKHKHWHSEETKKKISRKKNGSSLNLSEEQKKQRGVNIKRRNLHDNNLKEKQKAGWQRRWSDPEQRRAQSERMKITANNKEIQAKTTKTRNLPEYKERDRRMGAERWEIKKDAMREGHKSYYLDPIKKEEHRQKSISYWSTRRGWSKITIDGKEFDTIVACADYLGVGIKTVRLRIKRGSIQTI